MSRSKAWEKERGSPWNKRTAEDEAANQAAPSHCDLDLDHMSVLCIHYIHTTFKVELEMTK